MRRGNREDVVVRPRRAKAKPRQKPPTVAELAARVAWLEECQRSNVGTVEALLASGKTLTDRLAGVEWRQKCTAELAALGIRTVNSSADVSPRRLEGGMNMPTSEDAEPSTALTRATFNKMAHLLVIAALCLLGIAALLWWPWH